MDHFHILLQPQSQQTTESICQDLAKLKSLQDVSAIGHNLESWIIYQWFQNHDKHHPSAKLQKEGQCGDCNVKLYNAFYQSTESVDRKTINKYIQKRRRRGHFLSLLQPTDQHTLELYFDGSKDSFMNRLEKLPNMKWFEEDSLVRQKLYQFSQLTIK
jgi:hypothetical protein